MALIITFSLFLLFFCPIFVRIDLLFDKKMKKLFIGTYFYGFIKALSGYFTLEGKFVALHISKKKVILLEPLDILNKGKSYKALKSFEIFSIKSVIEIGCNPSDFILNLLIFYKVISENLGYYYTQRKYFAITKNDIIINENIDITRFVVCFKVAFNFYVIVTMVIKKLMEKISNAKKHKKY
jgi:hypothetical protein